MNPTNADTEQLASDPSPLRDATTAGPHAMSTTATDATKVTTTMSTQHDALEAPATDPRLCPPAESDDAPSIEEMQRAQREAWEQTRAEREAITPPQLAAANFDADLAVTAIRRAYRRVLPLRAQLVDALNRFDVRCLDNLPTYADAMAYGDERVAACVVVEQPAGANAEADKLIGKLLRALVPLAEAGHFPQRILDEVSSKEGRAVRAKCLSRIATAVLDLWPQLAGRTTITREMLAQAKQLSNALYDRRSFRGETLDPSKARVERLQAMTLAYLSYEEVRRAVGWIRWHEGDLVKLAPSVHRNEFQRSRRAASTKESVPSAKTETDAKNALDASAHTRAQTPAEPRPATPKQAERSLFARARPEDDVVQYGPNGLPLVPQDDPFAKD